MDINYLLSIIISYVKSDLVIHVAKNDGHQGPGAPLDHVVDDEVDVNPGTPGLVGAVDGE